MAETIPVETVPVSTLTLDPNNARRHSDRNIEAIAKSLDKFGQRRPLVVHRNIVIAGNGTLTAAQTLGWEKIDITRVPEDWTEDKVRAFAIADNRTAELANWDNQILLETLKALDVEFLESTGFDEVNVDAFETLFGETPDLDDLFEEHGAPTQEDGMSRVSFSVPSEVAARWDAAVKSGGSGSFLENVCTAIQAAYDALVVDE